MYVIDEVVLYLDRDSSVSVVTRLGVQLSTWALIGSLHHRVQTSSGAHPASYSVGSGFFFRGAKGAKA